MKIFFDFEFIENGTKHPIIPISLGMVREDGEQYYVEFEEVDWSLASDWVLEHVKPTLLGVTTPTVKAVKSIKEFCSLDKPEFWAYFADYDWVILCGLMGRMIDLPAEWPMYCLDIKQYMYHLGVHRDKLNYIPKPTAHNALSDALWNKDAYTHLVAKDALNNIF